jgi:hypothetical protein
MEEGLQSAAFNSNCFGMQQFSAMMRAVLAPAPLWIASLALVLAGCRKEDINAFSVPKETPPAAHTKPTALQPGTAPSPASLHWTTPAGWEEQAASGMRVGSFAVNKDGKHADISIIPLVGISGSELDNVNRWRGQVGLPPLEGTKLSENGEKVTIGSTPASLYDMAGTDAQTQQPTRIVASILAAEGTTWFFKMIGADDLVEKEKPNFKAFLQSVQRQSVQSPVTAAEPMALMSTGAPSSATAVAAAAAHGEKPAWEVPAGWKEQAPTSMRLASYAIAGEKGGKADISVIKLGGMAGGLLANVNRWRSQLGLEPVDQAGLEKLVSMHDVKGIQVTVVDMVGKSVESGEPSRLIVAVVPVAGATWFYKMLGPDQLVLQQKPAFIQFVESARYPHA